MQIRYLLKMTEKTITRFFAIQQVAFGAILFALAIVWPCAHIIKGTMNALGAIFSIGMLGVSAFLFWKSCKELRAEYNDNNRKQNSK